MTDKTASQKDIFNVSISKSMSYEGYRALVSRLVEQGKSTGEKQSEALSNYTMLNDKRMRRLDKTFKLSESDKLKINNFKSRVTWLVLTESWCGDAAQTMPMMHAIAELNEGIDFRVILSRSLKKGFF